MANYQPANAARPFPPWSIALLSERDLSLRVPVNHVVYPGASLRSACFGHNVYEDGAAAQCFSNLLASGFRRFVWDLYWDVGRRVWSFCPVELPQNGSSNQTRTTQVDFNATSVVVSTALLTGRDIVAEGELGDHLILNDATPTLEWEHVKRQATVTADPSSSDAMETASLDPSIGGTSVTTAAPSTTPSGSVNLIEIGPYACTETMDLPILAAVLADFVSSTSDTLRAFVIYLTLNLHVAAPSDDPLGEPRFLNGSSLPQPDELLSTTLKVNLTSLYTPTLLREERQNINDTWLNEEPQVRPITDYFNTTGSSHSQTENGWPGEGYVEFTRNTHRLFLEYGSLARQLDNYNYSGDADTVFPAGELQDLQTVSFDAQGDIESGCIYNQDDFTVAGNNNSWAITPLTTFTAGAFDGIVARPIPEVVNLTECGISPILNTTLLNQTADENPYIYNEFVRSASWAWAYGQPRNVSSSEDNAARIRCAAMNSTANGRWTVLDCTDKHYAACRVHGQPYVWRISSTKGTYSASEDACDDGQDFSAPVTALENQHLYRQMREQLESSEDSHAVFVNFNSLDRAGCWVQGVNMTCPYKDAGTPQGGRQIIVPIIASVIVLAVAALTLFVKCAANRQNTKRRRRRKGEDGWDYEGVPS